MSEVVSPARAKFSWEGCFYLPHYHRGEASARAFIEIAETEGLLEAIRSARGQFYAVYSDSDADYAFIDNAGFYCAYIGEDFVSPSFLDLIDKRRFYLDDVDTWGMFELIQDGSMNLDRTPILSIRRLGGDVVVRLSRLGDFTIETKGIPDILSTNPAVSFFEEVDKICSSLDSDGLFADFTAGLDTRLQLAILLSKGIRPKLSSTGYSGHPDIEIPAKLARKIGLEFYPVLHRPEELHEDFPVLLEASDSLSNPVNHHRDYQLIQAMKTRGMKMRLNGGGGGSFRDFWWLSEWPHIRSKHPKLRKFYMARVATKIYQPLFKRSSLAQIAEIYHTKSIAEVEELYSIRPARMADDYCAYYYHSRAAGGRHLTVDNRFVDTYFMFYEPDFVRAASQLPYSDRRNNRLISRLIAQVEPRLASEKTDRGWNLTDSTFQHFYNNIYSSLDVIGRAFRKMRYYATGKSVRKSPNDERFENVVRSLKDFDGALSELKAAGFINSDITADDVPTRNIGSIIAAGNIVARLE